MTLTVCGFTQNRNVKLALLCSIMQLSRKRELRRVNVKLHGLIVLCVGESKVPPVLYSTYSKVQSSACLYSTAVEAGSDAALLEQSASTIN